MMKLDISDIITLPIQRRIQRTDTIIDEEYWMNMKMEADMALREVSCASTWQDRICLIIDNHYFTLLLHI